MKGARERATTITISEEERSEGGSREDKDEQQPEGAGVGKTATTEGEKLADTEDTGDQQSKEAGME